MPEISGTTPESPYAAANHFMQKRSDMRLYLRYAENVPRVRAPDFLIIGAQKSGTTWLHRNMGYHPLLWVSPAKELNYFNQIYIPSPDGWEALDRINQSNAVRPYFDSLSNPSERQLSEKAALDIICEPEISDDWYGRIFGGAPLDCVCGEVTPEYAILPRAAISHIRRLNPSMHIFLNVRDPIYRAWSHLRMNKARGFADTTLDFISDEHEWRPYIIRSNYAETLRRWRAIFGADRVHIIDFDAIENEPYGILEQVCKTLGVIFDKRFFVIANDKVGASAEEDMPIPLYEKIKNSLEDTYLDILEEIPDLGKKWWNLHFI